MAIENIMNDKVKKVLSYIGVACFGAFIGMGALIGVSSCSKQDNQQQLKTKVNKKQRISYIDNNNVDSIIGSDHIYYAVAKNYQNDGKGTFYNGNTINLANSADYGAPTQYDLTLDLDITLINEDGEQWDCWYCVRSGVYTDPNTGISSNKLRAVFLNGVDNIYQASLGVFNREFCAFTFTNAQFVYSDVKTQTLWMLTGYFDVYDITDSPLQFTIIDRFNYNAFSNTSIDSFINHAFEPLAPVVTSSTGGYERTFSMPWFYSNGLVFNQIVATYHSYTGQSMEQVDGTYKTYSNPVNNYLTYFYSLKYVNEATGLEVVVCNRQSLVSGSSIADTTIYLQPAWTSNGYKRLSFVNDNLSLLNSSVLTSANQGYDTTIKSNGDVGLGNIFNLISMAFSSWLPILSISIVPGITLGLLLFLPLIAGIIILVIWIVKR